MVDVVARIMRRLPRATRQIALNSAACVAEPSRKAEIWVNRRTNFSRSADAADSDDDRGECRPCSSRDSKCATVRWGRDVRVWRWEKCLRQGERAR